MAALLHPRQSNSCPAGFQFWVCSATSTQQSFRGCCGVDACLNGGRCPESAQPPASGSASSSQAPTTTPAPTPTSTRETTTPTPTPTTPTLTPIPNSPGSSTISEVSLIQSITFVTSTTRPVITTPTTPAADQTTAPPVPTATNTDTSTAATPGPNKGAIIGGAVGGVLALLIAFIIVLCLLRRRQRREYSAEPPYGPVYTDKKPGLLSVFSRNHNSFPPSPQKQPYPTSDPHQPPTPHATELPSPSFATAELSSEFTAASELSASTPLDRASSSWSPGPSEVSFQSTAAVLSPARETHELPAEGSAQARRQTGVGGEAVPALRGGWPGMRSNLHSVRRPVPREEVPNNHILSFMDFDQGGRVRGTGAGGAGERRA